MNQLAIPADLQKAITSKSIGSAFRARLSQYAEGMSMPAERDYLVSLYNDKPAIQKCTVDSLATVLLDAAYTGLSLSPQLGLLYVVPYNMEVAGRKIAVAQAQIGYKGLLKMAYRSSAVASIQAVVVREKDPVFEVWSDENGRHVKHVEYMRGDRGKLTHAYTIATFKSGHRHIEIMSDQDIDKIKAAVKKKNFDKLTPAWLYWEEEMWKKSCLRRAWKYWPKDAALQNAEQVINELEPVVGAEIVTAPVKQTIEIEPSITDQQHTELHAFVMDVAGVNARDADRWLDALADQLGCNGDIRDLPVSRFQEAKDKISNRAEAVRKKRESEQR